MKYGRYITGNKSTLMVRVPDFKQVNFHKSKFKEAMDHRDELCAIAGRDPKSKFNHQADRIHVVSHADKKYKMPVGVTYAVQGRQLVSGWKVYETAIASISIGGKQISKSYSVDKYGKAEAIRLACDWRIEQFKKKVGDL